MVSEGAFNPTAVLVHVIAIAIGILLGLRAMDAIAPDLPGAAVDPGVSSSIEPAAVSGEDPDSLFLSANLAPALEQLGAQVGAGEALRRLRISPGTLDAETGDGEGLIALELVGSNLPERIAAELGEIRPALTLEDIGSMELVATRRGPRWYVQLDVSRTDVSPPWAYIAPLEGAPLEAGGAPPTALGE